MSYTSEYFAARENWRDWRIEARELVRLAQIERGARVLEIGCGGGGLLRILRARGADGVGVDTLAVALNLARKNLDADPRPAAHSGRGKWERGRTGVNQEKILPLSAKTRVPLLCISPDNHLPFASNSFDAVLGQHVVEHIVETDAALREWYRLLKPYGRLALATPNARYPDPAHFSDADHAHIFPQNELRRALTRAGFIVAECFTAFPFLGDHRLLRSVGVVSYNMFRRMPYFAERGRTIMISARKTKT